MKELIAYLRRQTKLDYETLMNKVWRDKDIQKKIIELNTREQLFKRGIDSEGDSLGDYSPVSVEVYGKPEGHIRLFDTGEFYSSFRVIPMGEDAEIIADTLKDDIDLAIEFGEEIIGLTDVSKKVLSKAVAEKIREILRKNLQIN